MALKFDNIQAKLGKAVDPTTLEQLKLPGKQITEVADFSKLKALKEIDLRYIYELFYNYKRGVAWAVSLCQKFNAIVLLLAPQPFVKRKC